MVHARFMVSTVTAPSFPSHRPRLAAAPDAVPGDDADHTAAEADAHGGEGQFALLGGCRYVTITIGADRPHAGLRLNEGHGALREVAKRVQRLLNLNG